MNPSSQLSRTLTLPTRRGASACLEEFEEVDSFFFFWTGLGVKTPFPLRRDASEEYLKFPKGEAAQ